MTKSDLAVRTWYVFAAKETGEIETFRYDDHGKAMRDRVRLYASGLYYSVSVPSSVCPRRLRPQLGTKR